MCLKYKKWCVKICVWPELGLVFVLKIHAQKNELIIWKLWLFDEKVGMFYYVSFQNISKILYIQYKDLLTDHKTRKQELKSTIHQVHTY